MRDETLDIEIVQARDLDGCPECNKNNLTIHRLNNSIGSVSKYSRYAWRCFCNNCKRTTVVVPHAK